MNIIILKSGKNKQGAGRISTTRAKMGLRPEFLSEHHQNWRAKRFLSAYNWGLKGFHFGDL